jgi:hypothetical protein
VVGKKGHVLDYKVSRSGGTEGRKRAVWESHWEDLGQRHRQWGAIEHFEQSDGQGRGSLVPSLGLCLVSQISTLMLSNMSPTGDTNALSLSL